MIEQSQPSKDLIQGTVGRQSTAQMNSDGPRSSDSSLPLPERFALFKSEVTLEVQRMEALPESVSVRAYERMIEKLTILEIWEHSGDTEPLRHYLQDDQLLRTVLTSSSLQDRVEAAGMLSGTTRTEILEQLCKNGILEAPHGIKEAASLALRGTEDPQILDWIVSVGLKSESPEIRRLLIGTISPSKSPRCVEIIRTVGLRDANWQVVATSARALAGTTDPETIRELCTIAKTYGDPVVRQFAIESLGETTDLSVVQTLETILRDDPIDKVRNAARTMLEQLKS